MTNQLDLFSTTPTSNTISLNTVEPVVDPSPATKVPDTNTQSETVPVVEPLIIEEELIAVEQVPGHQPTITVEHTILDEAAEFMDGVIDVVDDYVPVNSPIIKKLGWFKRIILSQKRRFKRAKMWFYKIGKFETDPKLRELSRVNRQHIIQLSKQIDILVAEVIKHRIELVDIERTTTNHNTRLNDVEVQAETNETVLADLKSKTSMMR